MSSDTAGVGEDTSSHQVVARRPFLTNQRLVWVVGSALVMTALVFFIADNFVLVEIRLATLRIQARLAWVMIVPLLLGVLIGVGWRALLHKR